MVTSGLMANRTFAVGDIHGDLAALAARDEAASVRSTRRTPSS